MELTHEFTVPATLAETWAAFDDIESVAACFPGAKVTSVEGDTFSGSVKVKLGPIALVYNGTGTFVEKDESAHRMVIEAKGKDKRGNGTAGADVVATMTDEGGATRVSVHTDLAITGKPAQFGRGVIQDVSDKLLGQFTACLEQKVGGSAGPEPAADAVPTGPATGTPEEASAVADGATTTAKAKQESAPPAPPRAAAPPPASTPAPTPPPTPAPAPAGDDALDLGATVLPVLAKTYWREGLIVVLVVLLLLGRRRRG